MPSSDHQDFFPSAFAAFIRSSRLFSRCLRRFLLFPDLNRLFRRIGQDQLQLVLALLIIRALRPLAEEMHRVEFTLGRADAEAETELCLLLSQKARPLRIQIIDSLHSFLSFQVRPANRRLRKSSKCCLILVSELPVINYKFHRTGEQADFFSACFSSTKTDLCRFL